MSGRICVGDCSWTDPTPIACGRFYPRGVSSAEARLRHYAAQFDLVDVDATCCAPPTRKMTELWAARTPTDFVVNVKAFALLTQHVARPERQPP